ncbi:RNA polymerase subunit sigma-70 [Microvirga tunisiensis]|uniref:RNA polymerase subunit sigma-70 n=2 Tax=Pannonibacter tanglangensis TaxID=2750084 RepID=A0ABW9ZIV6_9HYPH|nr:MULTISPECIES: DUF6596 domain-containing protein [unclassified Pannonibacter]NBN64810.1 RNA polymerase subunit sigma-70 [Pannonibacter sp. XCT-34]NBN79311.1 RNA polymerase subunit sigma-70 [Pannonibacter sp. XCT-53]
MSQPTDPDGSRRVAEQAARTSYGRLIAILSMRRRDIAAAEDALSEALIAALRTWPQTGVPTNPDAWLLTAARNRQKNEARARSVRQAAEPELMQQIELAEETVQASDRRLELMFVCAHPAIDPAARAPLMLQTVLGIDAATIARAFLVEPATMSQRLVRAKARIRDAGLRFGIPDRAEMAGRLDAVLDAIYAAFGQGWDRLDLPDMPEALTGEAIWLARLVVEMLPQEPEAKGLLALMLYSSARRLARRDDAGRFVPLDRQDPRLWDRTRILEAEALLTVASRAGRFGRYQCEAAIQSVHVQRPLTGRLNLTALLKLYDLLVTHADSIGARIGRAVVLAETGDIGSARAELDDLPQDRVRRHQPWWVARSQVSLLAGDIADAIACLTEAIRLTERPEIRDHLSDRRETLVRSLPA